MSTIDGWHLPSGNAVKLRAELAKMWIFGGSVWSWILSVDRLMRWLWPGIP